MNLKKIEQLVVESDRTCRCGESFVEGTMENYDHTDGWDVDGFSIRQWLYMQCSCKYGTSLSKIGFRRPGNHGDKSFPELKQVNQNRRRS